MILKSIYKVVRKNEVIIDKSIPDTYLLSFFFGKLISMVRGYFVTGKIKCFLGKHSRIKNRRKVVFGKYFNLDRNVYINGLSSNGFLFGDYVSIGCNTRIEGTGSFSYLGKGFVCGNNCGLGTDCFYGCAGGIQIGNDVIVGNYVTFHSENHNYRDPKIPIRLQGVNHKGIIIGNNCWIGAKSTILDGTVIGNGCVIAAGAVVTGVFPDNVIIAGVPAKIIKSRI